MTDTSTEKRERPIMPPDAPPKPPRRGVFGGRSRSKHTGGDPALSKAETQRMAERISDDPIELGHDDLACADCGAVCSGPIDQGEITYAQPTGIEYAGGAAISATLSPHLEVPMATCPVCQRRRALAADLAEMLPTSGVSVNGLRFYGEQVVGLVDRSLVGLSILRIPTPDPDLMSGPILYILVKNLGGQHAGLTWADRFSPVRLSGARPGTAGPRAWSHIRESTRADLRTSYARTMAERLALSAPPVHLSPPPLGPNVSTTSVRVETGCLFCGIATVARPARIIAREGGVQNAAADAWTAKTSVSSSLIGGRPSPTMLAGHLCPPCADSLATEGALGLGALERAVKDALGIRTLARDAAFDGVIAWGAVAADNARRGLPAPAPNAHPWAHLSDDLDALADRLRADDDSPSGLIPEAFYS